MKQLRSQRSRVSFLVVLILVEVMAPKSVAGSSGRGHSLRDQPKECLHRDISIKESIIVEYTGTQTLGSSTTTLSEIRESILWDMLKRARSLFYLWSSEPFQKRLSSTVRRIQPRFYVANCSIYFFFHTISSATFRAAGNEMGGRGIRGKRVG